MEGMFELEVEWKFSRCMGRVRQEAEEWMKSGAHWVTSNPNGWKGGM